MNCDYFYEILLEHYGNVLTDNMYVNYFVTIHLHIAFLP